MLIQTDTLMLGYWRNEEATRGVIRDGWLYSGDVGYLDEDGFVYLVGRKKDLIIKGGENIAPREIEEALYEHPDVAEAAAVGVPDPRLGEDIWAAVQLRAGATPSRRSCERTWLPALTKFKVPTRVVILDAMPKNATGKIQKREVKEILARRAGAAAQPRSRDVRSAVILGRARVVISARPLNSCRRARRARASPRLRRSPDRASPSAAFGSRPASDLTSAASSSRRSGSSDAVGSSISST